MKNYRSTGLKTVVVAASARVSGQAVCEQNIIGFAETDAPSGARYSVITEGEFEIAFIAGSLKGDRIDIVTATSALLRVAAGGAVAGGSRPFAQVTAVPGDGIYGSASKEPITGRMWVKLRPPVGA
jgi:predicted RecA/RadA family phage recombinase